MQIKNGSFVWNDVIYTYAYKRMQCVWGVVLMGCRERKRETRRASERERERERGGGREGERERERERAEEHTCELQSL